MALRLLTQLIEEQRSLRKWTQSNLAERAGVSRSTIQYILKGDPSVAIGTYFEVASLVGVSLFTSDSATLNTLSNQMEEKLSLLPRRVHTQSKEIEDDF